MRMEATLAGSSFAAASAGVFAQIDPATGWLSVIIQLGSFGLVAYLIIAGLPALQKAIMAERQAERGDFAKALFGVTEDRRAERVDFAAALRVVTDFARGEVDAIRAAAKGEVETLRAAFMSEQRDARAFYAAEAEAMRKVYFDSAAAMRTAVHDVRDVASATVNRANVAIEVAKVNRPPGGAGK